MLQISCKQKALPRSPPINASPPNFEPGILSLRAITGPGSKQTRPHMLGDVARQRPAERLEPCRYPPGNDRGLPRRAAEPKTRRIRQNPPTDSFPSSAPLSGLPMLPKP